MLNIWGKYILFCIFLIMYVVFILYMLRLRFKGYLKYFICWGGTYFIFWEGIGKAPVVRFCLISKVYCVPYTVLSQETFLSAVLSASLTFVSHI